MIEQRKPPSGQSNIPNKPVGRVNVGDVQKPVVETSTTNWLVRQITKPLPDLPLPEETTTQNKNRL